MYKYYFENAYFQNKFKVFINIARLSIEKDQEKLIYAFKDVYKEYPNTRLLILGDGPLREKLEKLIKKLKLQKSVFLLGRVYNPFPYLKRSDCFVMSSNHEGQPMTLLEALVLNKPVISTNFACAYDVLCNGEYGVIVENSMEFLTKAMKEFINSGMNSKPFDYINYCKNSMDDFYRLID
nr:glycosyltransferase [Campylobacter lanienae]